MKTTATGARPLLIYDGDCGFCGYSVRYWKKLTGDCVDFRPYQEVVAHYPAIPIADFQRAVQFITPCGHRSSAAEASFLILSHAPEASGSRLLWFSRFLNRLRQNEPAVTALLEKNPFPDKPPVYVRALLYEYNYADSNEKAEGVWWKRKLLAPYFPRSLFER